MSVFTYQDGDATCEGFVALPDGQGPHPAVLVVHNWAGQSETDNAVARKLAGLGYVGIAIDVYGKGMRGAEGQDNGALMGPWTQDRAALRQRLLAAVDAAKAHPAVNAESLAVIGYCFGGLCALDVARAAPEGVRAVASFHGIYGKPELGDQGPISAKVLVLHGWDDPMTPPDAMVGLAEELTAAGADWQVHAYGHTMHAFTNIHASSPPTVYSEKADRRSWQALQDFLAESLS